MTLPLRIAARPGSPAARAYLLSTGESPEAIAPGIKPQPAYDLVDHGGKTMPAMAYLNYYVGAGWATSDRASIDQALSEAMSDAALNEIMGQYFGGTSPTTTALQSRALTQPQPARFDQASVNTVITQLLGSGALDGLDLATSVVNLLLAPGMILVDSSGAQAIQGLDESSADSLHGLGGYHGSVHAQGGTVYYAVGVYSQNLPDGTTNGIVAFDQPWKNVVATFYHELNEARTDSDVDDAIAAGNDPSADRFLGWTSPQGYEVGDAPVFESSSDLGLVFKEVPLAGGAGTVPIQLMWSNRVHGPEAP